LEDAREWFRRHRDEGINWCGLSSEPCQVCGSDGKSGSSNVFGTLTGWNLYICSECLRKLREG